jgi:UDP-N-acetylenolpyruvoylglucosamine reductase
VNRGGGTAAEVLELVRMIQERVRERFGVELQPEPVFVANENPKPETRNQKPETRT